MSDERNQIPTTHPKPDNMPPTREQRLALVRSFQARALRQAESDPLAANLQVISGDLMAFAHRLGEAVQANLAAALTSPDGYDRFARDAELYLKFARQLDRFAQIERQLGGVSKKEAEGQ